MRQRAGEPLRIDAGAALQRSRDAECVVAEGEQTAAARSGIAESLARGFAHLARQSVVAQHPRHVGKHHAVDFLVGGGMRFVGIAQGVGGDVAGQVETQLRPQQARGARLARREDELDVGTAARLELELLADGGLDALRDARDCRRCAAPA